MGDASDNRPTSNPFALLVAQRQREEEQRRAALFARFSGRQWPASKYEALQKAAPFPAIASAQVPQAVQPPDQPKPDGLSLLRPVDDIAPLQLSDQTPPRGRIGSSPVKPSVGGEGLLNTADGPDLATPLIVGSMALGLPEDAPLIPFALLALAILKASQGRGQPAPPRFGGSTRLGGAVGSPAAPVVPPLKGFPAECRRPPYSWRKIAREVLQRSAQWPSRQR